MIPEVGARRTRSGGIQQKYFLDEPGRRLILARYDGKRDTTTELATRLGVPRRVLQEWARQLGVGRRRGSYRQWTEEEIQYLEANLHRTALTVMAHHLGQDPPPISAGGPNDSVCVKPARAIQHEGWPKAWAAIRKKCWAGLRSAGSKEHSVRPIGRSTTSGTFQSPLFALLC